MGRTFLSILALVIVPALSGYAIVESGRSFDVEMRGKPVSPQTGDPDGSGRAHLDVNPGRQEIAWSLTVTAIDTATAARLHRGVTGQNGPAVLAFQPPRTGASSGTLAVDRAVAIDILRNPRLYYVIVTTADYPDGALRGQLER
jgi:hypothetical protein